MYYKILLVVLMASLISSCNQSNSHEGHNQDIESHEDLDHDEHEENNHDEESHEGNDHRTDVGNQEENDEIKFQYTSYSSDFELFAEADAFIVGETANVLSHFSVLPNFNAVEQGKITIILSVNGKETKQTLSKPTRKGIYSFNIEPETQGTGKLTFEIANDKGTFEVTVPEVTVFVNHQDAHKASENMVISQTNTTVFTKEQSWKINFATEVPNREAFGRVIKTVAKIEPARGGQSIIAAKTSGIVLFSDNGLVEGKKVVNGQKLFSISSNELADNNLSVRLAEAKSNYETSKANYERKSELVGEKIISEQDFLNAKNNYKSAKAIYDNLVNNFNSNGQQIKSSLNGYIKQIYITNGQFVESGQALVSIAQNKNLLLTAQVQQKYLEILPTIVSANVKTLHNNKTYSFKELNGKVLPHGESVTGNSYMIPVNLQIENKAGFVPGTLTEVFLKAVTNSNALTVPNGSLLEEQGIYYVFVQVNPELFEKREVSIGGTDGLRTEITKGISEHDRIVTSGAMQVKLAQATGALDPHSGHVH
ncbi:MAG: efflux RND transporter periplasmic adaptor subunit [Bacteroidales bacterium]|nr:efflux RND transporter periplasmic adaptor subunit [Bacteroidales bacterium]